MPDGATCPSPAQLRDFLAGATPAEQAGELEEHLEHCPHCAALADRLHQDDPLLADLRGSSGVVADQDRGAVESLMHRLRGLPLTAPGGDSEFPSTPWASPLSGKGLLAQGPGEEESQAHPEGYQLLQPLGHGGMGVVYLARQVTLNRLVALKMLAAGANPSPERLARFRAETEAVARLQHPNIVPIYEVGQSAGQPYFTMEYVAGGSLAQRLAEAPLPPRSAAGLLEVLARAVHFAHQHGVIHRDLKPANILLSFSGRSQSGVGSAPLSERPLTECVAKITDFGLAKLVTDSTEEAPPQYQTQTGAILGTPAYMAPEQAAGKRQEIGPAADVWALGAILYECLTGRPPFKAATLLETLEQVRTAEPIPPARLQPGLPRDLDTVCLKCLAKEPSRRYPTAQALAEDLGRFLAGEPIKARPVTRSERLLKWARRKPATAALVVVSLLSLLTLAAGALYHDAGLRRALAEARREHDRADANYREARDTVEHMLAGLDTRAMAGTPRLKELQKQERELALRFFEGVLRRIDSQDPEVRQDAARAYYHTATLQWELGQREAADENARQAASLLESLAAEQPDVTEHRSKLAYCYTLLGNLCEGPGWEARARPFFVRALAIREELARAQPDEFRWQAELAVGYHNLGQLYIFEKRYDDATREYERAIGLRRRIVRDQPSEVGHQVRLAENYQNLGLAHGAAGRSAEAAANYRQAEEVLRPLADAHPANAEYALPLAATYTNWGNQLAETGKAAEALPLLQRAVALADGVLRQEPQHATARHMLKNAHGTRAQALERLGKFADAVKDWDRVVELAPAPYRWEYRLSRALARARAGEHVAAVAEARDLAAQPGRTPTEHFNLACIFALASGATRGDVRLPSDRRVALAEEYATQAVGELEGVRAAGYFRDNPTLLQTDPDLESLRGRADFDKLRAAVRQAKGR
jgi:serine/threonine-protein kinase